MNSYKEKYREIQRRSRGAVPYIWIASLYDLEYAVYNRRALIGRHSFFSTRPHPAAFIYNMNAAKVHGLIRAGLFIYNKDVAL